MDLSHAYPEERLMAAQELLPLLGYANPQSNSTKLPGLLNYEN
jgi:hypothetical protein